MLKIEGDANTELSEYLASVLPDDIRYVWVSLTRSSPIYHAYDVIGWASEAESENDDGRRAIYRVEVVDYGDDGRGFDRGLSRYEFLPATSARF